MPDENLLFYLNLNGELFYIISHRMKSQSVEPELQKTVYNDLAVAILNPKVIKDLLSGDLRWIDLSFGEIRTLMDRIVHSSIMSVNSYSMEKLFELTLIATKYQFSTCQCPKDILLIVLNHLDSMRQVLTEVYAIQLAEDVHTLLIDSYGKSIASKMQTYRFAILNYLQDVRLKMTNLIKLALQSPGGDFVRRNPDLMIHNECVRPGEMQIYEYLNKKSNKVKTIHSLQYDTANLQSIHRKPHSFELNGDRVIGLGMSIYEITGPSFSVSPINNGGTERENSYSKEESSKNESSNPLAVPGLDLCGILLGCEDLRSPSRNNSFKLSSSFTEPISDNRKPFEFDLSPSKSVNTVKIDGRKQGGEEGSNRRETTKSLAEIAREFDFGIEEETSFQNFDSIMDDLIQITLEEECDEDERGNIFKFDDFPQ